MRSNEVKARARAIFGLLAVASIVWASSPASAVTVTAQAPEFLGVHTAQCTVHTPAWGFWEF